MTSFTRLPRDPLQMALEWRAGRAGDAMEDDEFEGRAHPVCDSRAGQAGSFGAVVPGVRDFAADGVFVAAAVKKNADAVPGSGTEAAGARPHPALGPRFRADELAVGRLPRSPKPGSAPPFLHPKNQRP